MFKRLQHQLMVVCLVGTGLVLIIMSIVSLYFSTKQLTLQAEEAFESNLNSIFIHVTNSNILDNAWLSQMEGNENLLISIKSGDTPLLYTSLNEKRNQYTKDATQIAEEYYSYNPFTEPTSLLPETIMFQIEGSTSFFISDGSFPSQSITTSERYRASVSKLPYQDTWLTIVVLKNRSNETAQTRQLQLIFVGISFVSLIALAFFAWFFTGRAVKPIEENQKQQIEFVSSASHELRSPLAVMQATAGAMKHAPPEKVEQFSTTIENECQRLALLTSDLLELAQADRKKISMSFTLVEPETIVLTTSERFEVLALKKNIRIRVSFPEEALPKISLDTSRTEQLLGILVDNALEYTPEHGMIELKVFQKEKSIIFTVEDSGCGIPKEARKHIFTRFYQGDISRTKKNHYGLGLSIAKEIAIAQKGKLKAEESSLGGAKFICSFPL